MGSLLGAVLLVGAFACDRDPTESGLGAVPVAVHPVFQVVPQPASSPPDTGCGAGEAYGFSSHFVPSYNNRAVFLRPPTGSVRTRCGALPFDETGVGGVDLWYDAVEGVSFEVWARRLRKTAAPLQFEDSIMYRGIIVGDTQYHHFPAPAQDAHDLTAFGYLHAESLSVLPTDPSDLFAGALVDVLAQLWREQPQPASFTLDFFSDSQPQLTWVNQHRGRTADSTEIYRKQNGGSWEYRARVAGTATSFVDGPLPPAGYSYFIRHVTALASVVEDAGQIARPTSATTAALMIAIGAPPPTGLLCEGNFSPTMDCRWWRAVASAPSEILRDSVVRATLPGGAVGTLVQWTDSTVTSGQSYGYQARHVVDGAPGRLSTPPHAAVASPVAPENLNCAGTDPTTISCVWVDKEPDTVAVDRKVKNGDWTPLTLVQAGVMFLSDQGLAPKQHCYRARHQRGTAVTAWSNTACAVPGDGGPLHPIP